MPLSSPDQLCPGRHLLQQTLKELDAISSPTGSLLVSSSPAAPTSTTLWSSGQNGFWSSSIGSRLARRIRPVFVLGSYRVCPWAQQWDGNFRWGVNIYNFSWNPSNQRSRPVGPLNLLHNSIKSWFWPQLQFHVVVLIHKQLTFGHLAWTLNTLSLNLPALIHFVLP